jgi:methyl-accepting chemotaxis protein
MENFAVFALIIIGIITPLVIFLFRILFKNSLTFKIGLVVVGLLDTISILSFLNGAGGDIKVMAWMGPIGVCVIILGFTIIIRNLRKLVGLSDVIEQIADGDMTVEVASSLIERKDEIGKTARALAIMQENQNKIITGIKQSADEMMGASANLTTIAQKLSESATEQASATEEVSSAMEEMLAAIESNADQAMQTSKLSADSADEIKQSNQAFMKTVESIETISKKIMIIADIAAQTNILSLNASVEAARSGEAGKGFAIVAQEIRKLADTTNKASSEIDELSKTVTDVSFSTRDKLDKVVPGIVESAQLVKNIAAASHEQRSGAEMINISMQQLAMITNQNSESSEEMSGSAVQLSQKAKELKELVSKFKLVSYTN